ncbi:hypothetical protein EPI10_025364 [Gossypium australe]|uniref:Uncharacterized protein n=1 Tax=Gossypium australe TaxID=47621 RepID=A0A5B6W1J7_9ROSI|nr:hypothetical protein EPI10_025364 [Gossypium australe]
MNSFSAPMWIWYMYELSLILACCFIELGSSFSLCIYYLQYLHPFQLYLRCSEASGSCQTVMEMTKSGKDSCNYRPYQSCQSGTLFIRRSWNVSMIREFYSWGSTL